MYVEKSSTKVIYYFFPPLLIVFLKSAKSVCTSSSNSVFLVVMDLNNFAANFASTQTSHFEQFHVLMLGINHMFLSLFIEA